MVDYNKNEQGDNLNYYHGTDRVFDMCNKDVFWVSTTPSLANQYALLREDISKGNATVMQTWISAKRSFDADKLDRTLKIGPFLMELAKQSEEITGVKPSDDEMREALQMLRSGAYTEESGPWYGPQDFWFNPHERFGRDASLTLMKLYEKLGFDSISSTEEGELTIGILPNGLVTNALSQENIHGTPKEIAFKRDAGARDSFIEKVSSMRFEKENSLSLSL